MQKYLCFFRLLCITFHHFCVVHNIFWSLISCSSPAPLVGQAATSLQNYDIICTCHVYSHFTKVHDDKNVSIIFGTVRATAVVIVITILLFLPLPSSGQQIMQAVVNIAMNFWFWHKVPKQLSESYLTEGLCSIDGASIHLIRVQGTLRYWPILAEEEPCTIQVTTLACPLPTIITRK